MVDIYRMKKMFFQLRFYYTDTGETASIASRKAVYKKPIKTTKMYPPFKPEDRIKYFKTLHDELFKMQISSVLSRYGHRFGVSKLPGENDGSIDYELTLYKPDKDEWEELLIKIPINLFETYPKGLGLATAWSSALKGWINKSVYADLKKGIKPIGDYYDRMKKHGISKREALILYREDEYDKKLIIITDSERDIIKSIIDLMIVHKDNSELLIKYHKEIVNKLKRIDISESDIKNLMDRD